MDKPARKTFFNFFKTFALSVVLLASVFYVYKMEGNGVQKIEEEKEAKRIFNFKKDDIFFLRVRGGGGKDFEMEKQNGKWRIISPIEAATDSDALDDLISYVSKAEFEEVIHASQEQLGAFGIDASALRIDFYLAGDARKEKPYRLAIGDVSPTRQKVYVKTSMAESILTVKSIFKKRVSKTMSQLRKKELLFGDTDETRNMLKEWRGEIRN